MNAPNASEKYEQASKFEPFTKLAGFVALAMLLRELYYFANWAIAMVREGNLDYFYDPRMVPRYIGIALLIMVVRGIFKRDEYWGLWAGILLIINIFLKDQIITPIHLAGLGVPVKFSFNLPSLISILLPLLLGFLLLVPIVSMKRSNAGQFSHSWGSAIATFWNRTKKSVFLFALLCLGVILPSLSTLFPYKVGAVIAAVGALAMIDIMGPTQATVTGRSRSEAESKLAKEVERVETFRLNAFFIALAMIVYGLALMEIVK